MGSGVSFAKKPPVDSSSKKPPGDSSSVIDCSIDASLAAALQESEEIAWSTELAEKEEQLQTDEGIAKSLVTNTAEAYVLQENELTVHNTMLHEPLIEVKQQSAVSGEQSEGGLTQGQIDLLPTYNYAGHNNNCDICHNAYNIGDLLQTLPCYHIFHAACIDDWIKKNSTCPTCRKDIVQELTILSPALNSTQRPLTPSAPPLDM